MRTIRYLVVALGVLLALGFAGFGLLAAGMCHNTVLRRVPAPDGHHVAVLFTRDCGATTAASTQVSVLWRWERLWGRSGNALTTDSNHGSAPSGRGGGPVVDLEWVRPDSLQIRYDTLARIFQTEPTVRSVRISYAAIATGGV